MKKYLLRLWRYLFKNTIIKFRNYMYGLNKFCNFIGKLINEQNAEVSDTTIAE